MLRAHCMNESVSKVRGTITAKECTGSRRVVDLTIQDTRNRLFSLQYTFSSTQECYNVHGSISVGDPIEAFISGRFSPLQASYRAIGVITKLDPEELTPEWEDVNYDLFTGAPVRHEDDFDFSAEDLNRIKILLQRAKQKIREEFRPSEAAARKVDSRLDQLARQARETSAFDWKRLFVTAIVGVGADLGFGTSVPETLVNLFKVVFTEFIQQRLLLK